MHMQTNCLGQKRHAVQAQAVRQPQSIITDYTNASLQHTCQVCAAFAQSVQCSQHMTPFFCALKRHKQSITHLEFLFLWLWRQKLIHPALPTLVLRPCVLQHKHAIIAMSVNAVSSMSCQRHSTIVRPQVLSFRKHADSKPQWCLMNAASMRNGKSNAIGQYLVQQAGLKCSHKLI